MRIIFEGHYKTLDLNLFPQWVSVLFKNIYFIDLIKNHNNFSTLEARFPKLLKRVGILFDLD